MDGCGAEMLRVRDPAQPWLQLEFDTNPLHKKWDQVGDMSYRPLSLSLSSSLSLSLVLALMLMVSLNPCACGNQYL